MPVAIYVHLQPGVPAAVLPLGIKPPVIPLFVVALDVMVAVSAWKDTQVARMSSARDSVVTSNALLQ
jgi:hypothetical protein